MKNQLLFITDNFPPETNAPASRTYEHCVEWIKSGYRVKVITCHPNFPFGKVYNGHKNKLISREVLDCIEVIRLWSFIRPNSGFLLRAIDHLSFALISSIYCVLFVSADRIITTSPQFFVNITGLLYKFVRRKPWILELRDIWPESLKAVGSLNDGILFKLLERLELFFYRYASKIIVVTNSFKEDLSKRTISPKKIEVVKNGVNTRFFNKKNIVKTYALPEDKIILGYIGTHGMAHNLEFFLKAAAKLQVDESLYHFVFVGTGAQKEKLIQIANANNLKNVSFYDNVSKSEVPSILNQLDYALTHLKPEPTFLSVIPSKTFEIAAMQIPIINGVLGETAEIVSKNTIGVNYEPSSVDSFINNLNQLNSDQNLIEKIRSNQVIFAQENSRQKRAAQMLEYITNIG